MSMNEITSNEALTKVMVEVKRGQRMAMRLTKKHAKEHGISWEHFLNSARMLGLSVVANGNGHTARKARATQLLD